MRYAGKETKGEAFTKGSFVQYAGTGKARSRMPTLRKAFACITKQAQERIQPPGPDTGGSALLLLLFRYVTISY